MVQRENHRRLGIAPSGAGHGGRRKGAGRPRSVSFYWSGPRRTSSATLLRKFANEAIRRLVTIMRDQRVSYVARVKAAKKLLDWGYGAPPNCRLELPKMPEPPTREEIAAEMYRRGHFLRVLDLAEREIKRDRREDCETDAARSPQRLCSNRDLSRHSTR
jgi:hypothetical protein